MAGAEEAPRVVMAPGIDVLPCRDIIYKVYTNIQNPSASLYYKSDLLGYCALPLYALSSLYLEVGGRWGPGSLRPHVSYHLLESG